METLLIKVSERNKADLLVELLKSMDFIDSVDFIGDLKLANDLFNQANEIASGSDLKELTMDDINSEIKDYRLEKKSRGN